MTGRPRMHDGEVATDASLVRRLVAEQFPDLAPLPVRPVASMGTMNAIYRLGDELSVRLPLLRSAADSGVRELAWLPRLAPHVTLRIPEPVAAGAPGCGYPFGWAVHRWIDGVTLADHPAPDEQRLAADLAAFVLELRRIDPADAPPAGRRPLAELDGATRAAIEAADGTIPAAAAMAAWDRALEAPAWDGAPTWIHNDLLPPNLLVDPATARPSAVIDFGGAGVGDPAADVVPAWSVLGPRSRRAYRAALGVDDSVWDRARGYALHQAALTIPYYAASNPGLAALGTRTVTRVLADRD